MQKRGQAGVEYMIIIGFVTFAILTILILSFLYSGLIKDMIKLNQVESFALQLINHAESVFFSGEPSIATIRLYLPQGVENITILNKDVVITTMTSSGRNIRAFESNVPLQGTISPTEGIKRIILTAKSDHVLIS